MLPARAGIGRTLTAVAIAILHAPALARRIAPLTVGHASVDFTQGALPVLLPFLHREFGLSYLQDGILFLALTVSSSVTQPLFGHLSDRRSHRLLLPGAIMLASAGLAGCALAPNYGLSLLAIFLSGLGVAAYHPEASRLASVLSGEQRGTGMSLFSVGGNLGFALGAAGGGLIAAVFGLGGGWLLLIPGPDRRDARSTCGCPTLPRPCASPAPSSTGPATTGARCTCCSAASACAGTSTSACSRSSRSTRSGCAAGRTATARSCSASCCSAGR